MSGYCQECGNQQCLCTEIEELDEERKAIKEAAQIIYNYYMESDEAYPKAWKWLVKWGDKHIDTDNQINKTGNYFYTSAGFPYNTINSSFARKIERQD